MEKKTNENLLQKNNLFLPYNHTEIRHLSLQNIQTCLARLIFLPAIVFKMKQFQELIIVEQCKISNLELKDLQFEKIKKLLKYAYKHVPYYRSLYGREGIHPNDVKNYQDFEALPFITRDEVNQNLNDFVLIKVD